MTNGTLARVGSFIQMGSMLAQMIDSNNTGWDDKGAQIAQKVGEGFVKAATGDLHSAAGILDSAADALHQLAADIKAGKNQQ
jgi:hypothetical protein